MLCELSSLRSFVSVNTSLVVDRSLYVERHRRKLQTFRCDVGGNAKAQKNAADDPTRKPEEHIGLGVCIQCSSSTQKTSNKAMVIVHKHKGAPVVCPKIVHLLAVQAAPDIAAHELHDVQNVIRFGLRGRLVHEHFREAQAQGKANGVYAQGHIVRGKVFCGKDSNRAGQVVGNRRKRRGDGCVLFGCGRRVGKTARDPDRCGDHFLEKKIETDGIDLAGGVEKVRHITW